jgi:excisionase family DNA binding protein
VDTGINLRTPEEAADQLGLKVTTLRVWRRLGKGPAYVRLGKNTVRYRQRDLDEYVNELAA